MDGWSGFVDAFRTGPGAWSGRRAVVDTDLPGALGAAEPLRVVLSGGAGQLAGPVDLLARHDRVPAALDTALRDLDDPAGNARRVVAAAVDLPEETVLHVGVAGEPTPGWLRALDVLTEVEAVVALPLDRLDPTARTDTWIDAWIDAALDRELGVSLVGGSPEQAVAALRTTARLWGDPDDLAAARRWCRTWLVDDGPAALAALADLPRPDTTP